HASTMGTKFDHGVVIADPGTLVHTGTGGSIAITGYGGGDGTVNTNFGVSIPLGSTIEGLGTAPVTIQGTGGQGTQLDYGVFVFGNTTTIETQAADLHVTGTGGGSPQSLGVQQSGSPVIQSIGGGTVKINSTP